MLHTVLKKTKKYKDKITILLSTFLLTECVRPSYMYICFDALPLYQQFLSHVRMFSCLPGVWKKYIFLLVQGQVNGNNVLVHRNFHLLERANYLYISVL